MGASPPRYDPSIFECADLDQAKRVILTLPSEAEVEWHWREETPKLAKLVVEHLRVQPDDTVMDSGCGVGRLAREVIAQAGCKVTGVDISPTMRAMAVDYVASPRFDIGSPADIFDDPSAAGTFDSA